MPWTKAAERGTARMASDPAHEGAVPGRRAIPPGSSRLRLEMLPRRTWMAYRILEHGITEFDGSIELPCSYQEYIGLRDALRGDNPTLFHWALMGE